MEIPKQGMSQDELFQTMEQYRAKDVPWREGRAWGYVYYAGQEAEAVSKKAFTMFMSENALDPTVYPSLLRFEREVVAMARRHLCGGDEVVGNFTSGGTESIMLAVKSARDHARATRPEVKVPEMVVPETAHAAFHKAAHYLGLKLISVPVDETTFRALPDRMAEAVTDQTVLLVGSATSYAHGVVDPIAELGALARERNLLLHVDGCIGGFLLPYFRRLGADIPAFDFSVEGVTSVSMDLHKYAYAAKGASVILYRDAALRKHQIFSCARWPGYTVINPTVQSTKSGGPLAAAWAVLNFLGDDGYLEIARGLYDATRRLVEGIQAIPQLRLLSQPDMCLIAMASDEVDVFQIADAMGERGWYVQPQLAFGASPQNIHLTVGPNNVGWVEDLLKDLGECAAQAPAAQTGDLAAMVSEALGSGPLDDETYGQLLAMAGIEDGVVPERMAEINGILNVLPREANEKLLTEFVNQMFR